MDTVERHVKHFLRRRIEINFTKFEHQNIIAIFSNWNVVTEIRVVVPLRLQSNVSQWMYKSAGSNRHNYCCQSVPDKESHLPLPPFQYLNTDGRSQMMFQPPAHLRQ